MEELAPQLQDPVREVSVPPAALASSVFWRPRGMPVYFPRSQGMLLVRLALGGMLVTWAWIWPRVTRRPQLLSLLETRATLSPRASASPPSQASTPQFPRLPHTPLHNRELAVRRLTWRALSSSWLRGTRPRRATGRALPLSSSHGAAGSLGQL